MQLYEGLPIITNKITVEERKGIPHHLLGCIGIDEPTWVVGTFVKKALSVIEEIRARGKLPILVGGTHYYTQSLLFQDSLSDSNDAGTAGSGENEFVDDIESKFPILGEPTEVILRELRSVDLVMADRWHPNDRRKIQRSLQIYLQTGRKASNVYAEQRNAKSKPHDGDAPTNMRFPALVFWIHADLEILRDRLDGRVDKMLQRGLLDEVQQLDAHVEAASTTKEASMDETRGIWTSIGYKEFKQYTAALASPDSSAVELARLRNEAVEKTKIATRQYAKRQVRWIRIKLINALLSASASDALYLLDGTDVSRLSETVLQPAAKLTQSFIDGQPMPPPTSLSDAAAENLVPKQDHDLSDAPNKWIREHCELCQVTCVTEKQWVQHTKSRSHRRLASKRRAQGEVSTGPIADNKPGDGAR
jgi:tRNA dimethylallyltransferase